MYGNFIGRLRELGAEFCEPCNAYMWPGHEVHQPPQFAPPAEPPAGALVIPGEVDALLATVDQPEAAREDGAHE